MAFVLSLLEIQKEEAGRFICWYLLSDFGMAAAIFFLIVREFFYLHNSTNYI